MFFIFVLKKSKCCAVKIRVSMTYPRWAFSFHLLLLSHQSLRTSLVTLDSIVFLLKASPTSGFLPNLFIMYEKHSIEVLQSSIISCSYLYLKVTYSKRLFLNIAWRRGIAFIILLYFPYGIHLNVHFLSLSLSVYIFIYLSIYLSVWQTGILTIDWLYYVFCSDTQSCPTLCNPTDCSSPSVPVQHQLLEFAQTQVHQVGNAIQPSHPPLSPSPPAFSLSQHQGLSQWVSSLQQVAKILELQL